VIPQQFLTPTLSPTLSRKREREWSAGKIESAFLLIFDYIKLWDSSEASPAPHI
jgi:hypothetical protein